MAQRLLATLGTAAITDGSQVEFSIHPALYRHGNPVLSIKGLATDETVSLWKPAGDDWVPVTDSSDTAVTFTATAPADTVTGGRVFGVTKVETAGAVEVYVEDPR